MSLADEKCEPCAGGAKKLSGEELATLAAELPGWAVVEAHHLTRAFKFPNFLEALAFVNRAGAIAEEMGHHPDMLVGWGKAEVTIWTHSVGGLTRADFVLAARIERT
jgi:4a-hydroxytetrahydrobiopterin dehydratase